MFYYSYFSGQGRAILANELNVEDPFALSPADVVERVLMAGYTPAVELPSSNPWSQIGTVTEVHREGLVFLVAVSRDEGMIGLQEARAEPYEAAE